MNRTNTTEQFYANTSSDIRGDVRKMIAQDVEQFLANGGKIKQVPIGETGYEEKGLRKRMLNTGQTRHR